MQNAAAIVPTAPARSPLPKADFRASDPQAPDFADLLDVGSEAPPKDTQQRADSTSRADNAPPTHGSAKTSRTDNTDSNDDAARDTSDAPPQSDAGNLATKGDAKTETGKDSASDSKDGEKSAGADKADDTSGTEKAAEAETVITAVSADVAVAAQVGVAVAVTAVQPTPDAPSDDAIAPLQTVAAGSTTTAAAGDAALQAKAEATAKIALGDSQPAATAEQAGDAVPAAVEAAAQPVKPVAAGTKKVSDELIAPDADAEPAQAGNADPKAAADHAAEFVKSVHVADAGKTHGGEHASKVAAEGDQASDITATTLAPTGNPPPAAVGVAAATPVTDAGSAAKSSARSGATADAGVPIAGLAVEIASRAKDGNNRFEIRLDPPDLGRIDVRLDIDGKGNVTSRLLVERADTLDLLRRDFSALERALNDAGLKTGDNSLQFAMRDQGFGGNQRQTSEFSHAARVVVPHEADVTAGVSRYSLPRLGGIDIRV